MSSLNTDIKSQINRLVIGTRGSPLALWQANMVKSALLQSLRLPEAQVEIKILKTSGDAIKGHLSEFGGKGLFTRELEEALLDGRIDLAVHSMKDVPTLGHKDLHIAAILPREDPRDALIARAASSLEDLPQGAVIGTASIRRRAQLASLRPDVEFTLLRGNVGTRLAKLEAGSCDATFLACAGLKRLGQEELITQTISPKVMLPAPAQGAVGIEVRADNAAAKAAAEALDDFDSRIAITAERAFLRALDGSCRTPIAALAELKDDALTFRGQVLSKDGQMSFDSSGQMPLKARTADSIAAADSFGFELGQALREEINGRIVWDD